MSAPRRLYLLEVGVRWPPETFVRWKLEAMVARGLRVAVASRSIFDAEALVDGVELLELPQAGAPARRPVSVVWRGVRMAIRSPRTATRLLRGIRRLPEAQRQRYGGLIGLLAMYLPLADERPDVVHFEWLHAAELYLPMFGVWGCPVVASCHGSELTVDPHVPGQRAFAALLPELLGRASAVHCVSDSLRRAVLELGAPSKSIRVIRQGVDPGLFCPSHGAGASSGRALRVIAVGWPRWVKGLEWGLAALRRLLDAGVSAQLEILGAGEGDPTERRRLAQTIADLQLDDHVRLGHGVESAEVARRLRDSDVLLLPSLAEGLPTVLLEAMGCGLPVVATDCGGVSEAVSDGVEGFLVPPRDTVGLAKALERLWRDPALRETMGRAARETVVSRFTLARQLEEFLALYKEVARA